MPLPAHYSFIYYIREIPEIQPDYAYPYFLQQEKPLIFANALVIPAISRYNKVHMFFLQNSTRNEVLHLIIKTHQADKLRRFVRILTLLCVCLLLVGIPASAARMGSVDINGSEVAYQAQYKAYTEAASGDDAVVCKFTVSNPTAGKNGALCRIILPQSQNVYLYMDAGDLAVMRYDGSEYKKFCADYQLKRGTTYTLCVFRDGLVFFDGTRCYTYSGNLYGFTDVIAGWSGESNVFSTTLTKQMPTSDTCLLYTSPSPRD